MKYLLIFLLAFSTSAYAGGDLSVEDIRYCHNMEEITVAIQEQKQKGVSKADIYAAVVEVDTKGSKELAHMQQLTFLAIDLVFAGGTAADMFDACIAGKRDASAEATVTYVPL